MTTTDYLDAFKLALGLPSDYAAAKRLGVTVQKFSGWRTGYRLPDTLTLYEIADAIGANPAKVIADVERERAWRQGNGDQESAWSTWSKKLAAVVLPAVMVGTMSSAPSPAAARANAQSSGDAMFVMSTRRALWRRLVADLRALRIPPLRALSPA